MLPLHDHFIVYEIFILVGDLKSIQTPFTNFPNLFFLMFINASRMRLQLTHSMVKIPSVELEVPRVGAHTPILGTWISLLNSRYFCEFHTSFIFFSNIGK